MPDGILAAKGNEVRVCPGTAVNVAGVLSRLALVANDASVVKDKVALFFNFGGYLQTLTAGKK